MAYLTLEDGTIFKGEAFGAKIDIMGEVVFNTGMTGYQEVLTDPSYCGQIVTMTYPLIGNYGIDEEISESAGPNVRAFVMREMCMQPSNWNCRETLQEYLEKYNVVGLAGIDTRELKMCIRDSRYYRAEKCNDVYRESGNSGAKDHGRCKPCLFYTSVATMMV